jgi:hypothetical protein
MLYFLRKLLSVRRRGVQAAVTPMGSRLFDGATLVNEEALSTGAKAWLVSLPAEVWPQQICVRRPDVVNEFARLWKTGHRCDDYFVCLTLDDSMMGPEAPTEYREELIRLEAFYLQAKVDEDAAQERG